MLLLLLLSLMLISCPGRFLCRMRNIKQKLG